MPLDDPEFKMPDTTGLVAALAEMKTAMDVLAIGKCEHCKQTKPGCKTIEGATVCSICSWLYRKPGPKPLFSYRYEKPATELNPPMRCG